MLVGAAIELYEATRANPSVAEIFAGLLLMLVPMLLNSDELKKWRELARERLRKMRPANGESDVTTYAGPEP
jgi:hypothetical protein